MKITKVYPNCDLFEGKDGYWVSCPEKLIEPILAVVEEAERKKFESYGREAFLSTRLAATNPGLVEEGCYYFLVAEDCSKAIPMPPYYPHSGQWNGYNPFRDVDPVIEIPTLEKLKVAMAELERQTKQARGSRFISTEEDFIITPPRPPKK
jgi:hypothetical protein